MHLFKKEERPFGRSPDSHWLSTSAKRIKPIIHTKSHFSSAVLAMKCANPQADTSKPALSEIEGWEEEIDQWVYQLYGLTEEEIRIVEGHR